jgi:hypothetical protein
MIARHRIAKGIGAAATIESTISNQKVPLTYKKMLIQNFLIPILMYGSEIYGMNASRTILAKKVLDNSLKRIVKRHNFCRKRVYNELGLKDPATIATLSRARGFLKWENSNGRISDLIKTRTLVTNRKRTWSQVSQSWLKRFKIDSEQDMKSMSTDILNCTIKSSDDKDKSIIGEIAKEYHLKNGKSIRLAQQNNVLNPIGVNSLFRMRIGTFNYSDNILRMVKNTLDPETHSRLEKRCLCCKEEAKENIEHMLLFCKSFERERIKHLKPLIDKIKTLRMSQEKFINVVIRTLLGEETPASGWKKTDSVVYTINYLSDIVPKRTAIIAELTNAGPRIGNL